MATKEQLTGSLEVFREHRQRLNRRVALVDQIISEIETMLGEGETFAGEYSSDAPPLEPRLPADLSNGKAKLNKSLLFGKSIGDAVVAVLRANSEPMGAKEIVGVLEDSGYQFGTGDHYFGVYRALSPDRRPSEIIKQGKLYGIRRQGSQPNQKHEEKETQS